MFKVLWQWRTPVRRRLVRWLMLTIQQQSAETVQSASDEDDDARTQASRGEVPTH